MLIYEKDNKLNISFENNMDETDIVVGKDEVKIGEATISDNNVLPVPEEGDTGKVPTVQEDGSYALANAGGGGAAPFVVTFNYDSHDELWTVDKTFTEINNAYNSGSTIIFFINYFTGVAVRFEENGAIGYGCTIIGANQDSGTINGVQMYILSILNNNTLICSMADKKL